MWFKYPIIILSFFIAALLQVSFVSYFNIMGLVPNLIFILFFILFFFSKKEESFFISLIAGFFLDIISPSYLLFSRQIFGISVIALSLVYFFQKLIIYFFKKDDSKYLIFYFLPLFSLNFILYNAILYLFSIIFGFGFNIGVNLIISLIYNLTYEKRNKRN